jgi:hypothetical protein
VSYAREFGKTFPNRFEISKRNPALHARITLDQSGPTSTPSTFLTWAADFSPQQLVRFIETDRRAWSQLRSLLKTYDDCVRTGDGTRYKRPFPDDAIPTEAPIDDRTKLRDNHESWKRILRSLVLRAAKVPPVEELSNALEAH